MLDKTIRLNILFDFYGKLLSGRCQEVFLLYYEENLSLSEISMELNVSRQAVHDALHRAMDSLEGYEEKLRLAAAELEKNSV